MEQEDVGKIKKVGIGRYKVHHKNDENQVRNYTVKHINLIPPEMIIITVPIKIYQPEEVRKILAEHGFTRATVHSMHLFTSIGSMAPIEEIDELILEKSVIFNALHFPPHFVVQ